MMGVIEFPRVVWEFVAAINARDLPWLESLFCERCEVSASGYQVTGLAAVAGWLETEILEPCIAFAIDDVRSIDGTTTLHVRAADHGSVNDCWLEFHTAGRYIESLTITTEPQLACLRRAG